MTSSLTFVIDKCKTWISSHGILSYWKQTQTHKLKFSEISFIFFQGSRKTFSARKIVTYLRHKEDEDSVFFWLKDFQLYWRSQKEQFQVNRRSNYSLYGVFNIAQQWLSNREKNDYKWDERISGLRVRREVTSNHCVSSLKTNMFHTLTLKTRTIARHCI